MTPTDFKPLLLTFYRGLLSGSTAAMETTLRELFWADHVLHGPCPIDDCLGLDAQAQALWAPLRHAFPDLERCYDILLGGVSEVDPVGSLWITALGHYVGTFERPWLRIPATGRPAWLRYAEYHRLDEGRIRETYLFLDIPDLMRQAGVSPFPGANGVEILVPGPSTGDGIILAPRDPGETAASLALVKDMIGGLGAFDRSSLASMGMERFWHPAMMWYGPGGVGTTRGLAGFQTHYQRHFLHAFPDRKGAGHKARFAEGAYVATTGWPSVRATFSGGWLGQPAPNMPIGMRVMDVWRREGDLLRENWVLIDLGDLMRQTGFDIFGHL